MNHEQNSGHHRWSNKVVTPVLLSQAAESAGTEPERLHPRVGILVEIIPSKYERSFWNSVTWREAARGTDMFFFVLALLNNVLLVRFQTKFPPSAFASFHELACVYIVLALVQTAWGSFPNKLYHQLRPYLVIVNRVIRLFHLAVNIYTVTQCFVEGSCVGITRIIKGGNNRPQLTASMRTLLVATQCFTVNLHTIYLRFPFKTQFVFQSIYLIVLVLFNSVTATHVLNEPHFIIPMRRICEVMDTMSSVIFSMLVGWVTPQHQHCSLCGPWLVVIFTTFFLGFVLPLYCTYRIERSLKRRYIHKEVFHEQDPFATWRSSILGYVGDCLCMLLYAALSWQVVIIYHRDLLKFVIPTEWKGADSDWYWQLLTLE